MRFATINDRAFDTPLTLLMLSGLMACLVFSSPIVHAFMVTYVDIPESGASTSLTIDTTVADINNASDLGSYPGAGTIIVTKADGTVITLAGLDLSVGTSGNGTTTFIAEGIEGVTHVALSGGFKLDAVNNLSGLDGASRSDFVGGSVVYDPDVLSDTDPTIINVGSGEVTVTPIPNTAWLASTGLAIMYSRRRRALAKVLSR